MDFEVSGLVALIAFFFFFLFVARSFSPKSRGTRFTMDDAEERMEERLRQLGSRPKPESVVDPQTMSKPKSAVDLQTTPRPSQESGPGRPVSEAEAVRQIKEVLASKGHTVDNASAFEVFLETHEMNGVYDQSLLPWLQKNRDPQAWYQTVNMNWDLDITYQAIGWVLQQPDCPNAFAVKVIAMATPKVFGEAGPPNHEGRWVALLRLITKRDLHDPFVPNALSDEKGFDREQLKAMSVAAAQATLDSGKAPWLAVPENTLATRPSGPSPESSPYFAEENGIAWWVRRSQ